MITGLIAAALWGVTFQGPADLAIDGGTRSRDKEPVTYDSGGLKINALLSKPAGIGPFPLVLVNHGGFEPAKSVSGFLDLFAAQGYVAFASDYRGCGQSEGSRELAKGEVDDVLNGLAYAKTLPFVDSKRVALWGFSHGAAISLLAAGRTDAIRAVVAVQGPIELADCYGLWVKNRDKPGIKPLVGVGTLIGGTPDRVPAAWRSRSALYVADTIKCPVLLIYSDKDDAIPVDQGERMVAALKKAGNRSAELVMVKDAGHGLNPKAWAEVAKPMLDFLNREVGRLERR